MILHIHASYPHTRTYVLKLHRDCAPTAGHIAGRIEHVASGQSVHFDSLAGLAECLAQLDATVDAAQERGT